MGLCGRSCCRRCAGCVCVCEGDALRPAGGELAVLAADIGLGAAG